MYLRLLKRICLTLLIICLSFWVRSVVFANDEIMDSVKETYGLKDIVNILESYIEDLDLESVSDSILTGEGLDVSNILDTFVNLFFKEVKIEIKTFVRILVVILLFAVIKCLELEKGSLYNVANLIIFLVIVTMILKSYIEILDLFKGTINTITKVTEVVSPVVLTLLIATGEVVTSGIIGPVIMFLTALSGIIVTSVVLPLLNITLVFKIMSSISERVNLEKLGGFFSKIAMWTVSVVFALVLGVLGLETTVSTSVDAVAVKTTQAAVSNLIPVVGKFVSDSAELVMGASEIIGKTVGVLGIIVIIIVLTLPAIKMLIISGIYAFLEGVSEILIKDGKIIKIIGAFSKQYSSLAGIMIGIGTVFVITLALAISLFGKAVA